MTEKSQPFRRPFSVLTSIGVRGRTLAIYLPRESDGEQRYPPKVFESTRCSADRIVILVKSLDGRGIMHKKLRQCVIMEIGRRGSPNEVNTFGGAV